MKNSEQEEFFFPGFKREKAKRKKNWRLSKRLLQNGSCVFTADAEQKATKFFVSQVSAQCTSKWGSGGQARGKDEEEGS